MDDIKYFKRSGDSKLIVFIHGITGSNDTWQNDTTSFNFPESMHKELQDYSSYVFCYDSNKFSNSIDFQTIVKTLSLELENIQAINFEEIIFIAHSMGGLIAKTILIDITLPYIKKVNKLILLATPNNGNFFPSIISHLSNNPQFSNLKPIHNNIFLQQLTDMWITIYGINGSATNSIQCYCGYEELRTYFKVLVPLGDVISSCCNLVHGFKKNHITISKPIGIEDEVFKWVKEKIECKLSMLEKYSKNALAKLYINHIEELENKILDLEKNVIVNFNNNLANKKVIDEYTKVNLEKSKLYASFSKLDILLTNNTIEEYKVKLLLDALMENDLSKAIDIFSEEEIDKEIEEFAKVKDNLIQKIRIKIELYTFINDLENVEKYYSKLFKIDKTDSNQLEYANIKRYYGDLKTASSIYTELIKISLDDNIKVKCLNNLGTMGYEEYIPYLHSAEYLKEAIEIYERLYALDNNEFIFISMIETKLNYIIFDAKLNQKFTDAIKKMKILRVEVEILDSSSESYSHLKFNILNNILAVAINIENIDANDKFLKDILSELDSIIKNLINNNMHLLKKYTEKIALYYYNCGAYYGYLCKYDTTNQELKEFAINNFKKALHYRQILLPQVSHNFKSIVEIQKSIGIVFADTNDKENAIEIFEQSLSIIDRLISQDKQNIYMYYKLKVEILIDIISMNQGADINIEKYNEAITYLDKLNIRNKNAYTLTYCRIYLMTIPSMKTNKEKQELYDLAMQRLVKNNTDLANNMRNSLNEYKRFLKF